MEYDENDNPIFRFYRFASLVNNKENEIPDNQNDQTYMIDGNFIKLTVRVDNFGESWGISGDFIETGLKISPKKIEVSYMKDYETFSIKHFDSYSLYLNINFLLFIFILINLFYLIKVNNILNINIAHNYDTLLILEKLKKNNCHNTIITPILDHGKTH